MGNEIIEEKKIHGFEISTERKEKKKKLPWMRIIDISAFIIGSVLVFIGSLMFTGMLVQLFTGIELKLRETICYNPSGGSYISYNIIEPIDYFTGSIFFLLIGLVVMIAILDKYDFKTQKKEKIV